MALDDHDQLQNDNCEIDVGLRGNPESLVIMEANQIVSYLLKIF